MQNKLAISASASLANSTSDMSAQLCQEKKSPSQDENCQTGVSKVEATRKLSEMEYVDSAATFHPKKITDFKVSQVDSIRHDGSIEFACFSPDNKHVVTSHGKTVKISSRSPDGNWIHTSVDSHGYGINLAEFSLDGHWLLIANFSHSARVFVRNSDEHWQHGQDITHSAPIGKAMFSPNGHYLLTTDFQSIKIHCVGTKDCWVEEANINLNDIVSDAKEIFKIDLAKFNPVFSTCNNRFVVRTKHTARVYARENDGVWKQETTINSHDELLYATFSPDDKELITVVWGGETRKVNFYTRNPDGDWIKQSTISYDQAFFRRPFLVPPEVSPNGNYIMMINFSMCSCAGIAVIHGRHPDGSWQEEYTIHHAGRIHTAAFSSDSSHIVTTGGDNLARIHHRDSVGHWKETATIDHGDWVVSGCFSPANNFVMTSSVGVNCTSVTKIHGRTADEKWVPKATFPRPGDARFPATLSPDGSHALTLSSPSKEAIIWSIQSDHVEGQDSDLKEPLILGLKESSV